MILRSTYLERLTWQPCCWRHQDFSLRICTRPSPLLDNRGWSTFDWRSRSVRQSVLHFWLADRLCTTLQWSDSCWRHDTRDGPLFRTGIVYHVMALWIQAVVWSQRSIMMLELWSSWREVSVKLVWKNCIGYYTIAERKAHTDRMNISFFIRIKVIL